MIALPLKKLREIYFLVLTTCFIALFDGEKRTPRAATSQKFYLPNFKEHVIMSRSADRVQENVGLEGLPAGLSRFLGLSRDGCAKTQISVSPNNYGDCPVNASVA